MTEEVARFYSDARALSEAVKLYASSKLVMVELQFQRNCALSGSGRSPDLCTYHATPWPFALCSAFAVRSSERYL